MRTLVFALVSCSVATAAIGCGPHRAARVQAQIDRAERPDAPVADRTTSPATPTPATERAPGDPVTSFADLAAEIHAQKEELHRMNFFSMDDNYSMNTLKGILHGTAPADRPRIQQIVADIKARTDRMLASSEAAADPKKRAYAEYVRANADRALKKMETLAQLSAPSDPA